MNENINLCEILKGHEGEIVYSSCYGYIELTKIGNCILYFDNTFKTNSQGKINDRGECVIFPSKDQRDWNKWIEEQKPKVPKTWSELYNSSDCTIYNLSKIDNVGCVIDIIGKPIEKSSLALLKIHQLIEVGYGGNNIDKTKEFYSISYDTQDKKFIVRKYEGIIYDNFITSFHTHKQAEEFISYPENIQLLKDYFMINE